MILWCITGFSRNNIPHSLVIWRHLWRKLNHLLKLVYENLQLWDNNPITHRKENWIRRGKNNTRMPIGTVASMTALNPAIQQELGDIIFDYVKVWADDIVIDLQKKMSMWTLWCQWWRYWIMQASAEVSTNEICCIHVSLLGNGTDARCYYSLCSITEPITEPLKYGRKLKWLSRLFKKPQTQIVGTTVFSQKCLQHLGAWFRKSNKDKVTKKEWIHITSCEWSNMWEKEKKHCEEQHFILSKSFKKRLFESFWESHLNHECASPIFTRDCLMTRWQCSRVMSKYDITCTYHVQNHTLRSSRVSEKWTQSNDELSTPQTSLIT